MKTDEDRISALEARAFRLEMQVLRLLDKLPSVGLVECPTCLLPIGGNRVIRCTDDECSAGLKYGGTA